ncbi:hypothetical protein EAH79_04670 [Sphingomonas koreensis]|nr:hypothetical protein EAH79_04670 [Sphingomonas koreensis]
MNRLLMFLAIGLCAAPAVAQDTLASDAPPAYDQDAAPADAAPARGGTGQKYISPYIELGQIVTADLTNDDVLTYSEVAAGVDAGISTRNSEAQVSYRYERDIAWSKHDHDSDYHEGLARAAVGVAPGVSLEGGALATRSRADIRGGAPAVLSGNVDNVSQVYAVYAGPTIGTHVGPVGISASYRYGYTKVEDPSFTPLDPGQPRLNNFDSAHSNVLQGSLSIKSGDVLPVGVTVSGGWDREDAHQLDQRYDGKFARGDVVLPVSRTLALEAGVGYEKIEISQRDPVVDAGGAPVVDNNGRFITDKSSPRRIAYRTDGLIYDAGVLWKPSPRTQLEAHVGHRYGSTSYAGNFNWAVSESLGAQVVVYDEVDTFARQLRNGIDNLPTSFVTGNGVFGNRFNGCTFGTSGAAAGGCLNNVFQSISSSGYRARGIDAVIVASRGPVRSGFGVGYAQRHFYAPSGNTDFTISGVDDESYYAQYFLSRALDSRSSIEGDLYADYYDSGIPGAGHTFGTGATGSYNRSFGRIQTVASLGLFAYDADAADKNISAQALISARYQF